MTKTKQTARHSAAAEAEIAALNAMLRVARDEVHVVKKNLSAAFRYLDELSGAHEKFREAANAQNAKLRENHQDVVDSLNKTISEMVNEFAARDTRERAYRLVLSDMIYTALESQKR